MESCIDVKATACSYVYFYIFGIPYSKNERSLLS